MVFTFIEHDLQGRHPYHQQNQPHHVDRRFRGLRFIALQHLPAHQPRQDGERRLADKDVVPAKLVANDTAKNRPHDGRNQRGHTPDANGHMTFVSGEDPHHQRLRQWHQRAAGEAQKDAEQHQHIHTARHAAQSREDAKHQQADNKYPQCAKP